jgi:hypothetical protein
MAPVDPEGYGALYERLEELRRSADQDVVVRRLLNAGLRIVTLDMGHVHHLHPGESFPSELHLIFRDHTGMRWVVDRSGRMSTSGRTEWMIVP